MLCQVGPRDGLQNEGKPIPTETKVELIERLAAAGLPVVEATSFVSPKWVPQLADAAEVMARIRPQQGVRYPVLAPNMKVRSWGGGGRRGVWGVRRACMALARCVWPGQPHNPGLAGMEARPPSLDTAAMMQFAAVQGLDNALKAGAKEVAIFTAASEAFSRANTNVSIDDGLRRLSDVAAAARKEGVAVRGYVSCVVGCPYQVRCWRVGRGWRKEARRTCLQPRFPSDKCSMSGGTPRFKPTRRGPHTGHDRREPCPGPGGAQGGGTSGAGFG